MPVGFGVSVGDLIAVLKLLGTIIDALRESSRATTSFRGLIDELYALETALLHVKRLDPDTGHNVDIAALRVAAVQCQRTIDAFYRKIQKYQPHLQQQGTDSTIKDAWMRVKWAVCKKGDLDAFRAEIRGHTGSLEILLLSVAMESTTVQGRKQDEQHRSLGSRIQQISCQIFGKLSAITDSIAQNIQQGKQLLESSAQIIQTNLRIFQIVHDMQLFLLGIPGQIQRQQPVYLIDPYNKECPFHLEFVRSAEALLAILKVNLKESGCGPEMIDRGEFVIEEMGTQRVIDITDSWDICFYPGQRVAMSMVFRQQSSRAAKASCPRCTADSEESTEKEITW
jgi:hypothetical protein